MSDLKKIQNGDVLIIDNALPINIYSHIKNIFYRDNFSWDYVSSTAVKNSKPLEGYNSLPSFGKACFLNTPNDHVVREGYASAYIECALNYFLAESDIRINNLMRIRAGMIMSTQFDFKFHHPHIDMYNNHLTALLYLSTCDAPTRIFNEKFDSNFLSSNVDISPETSTDFVKKRYNGKLTKKIDIDSVENRLVIFDGLYYHSSSVPTDISRRLAININFN